MDEPQLASMNATLFVCLLWFTLTPLHRDGDKDDRLIPKVKQLVSDEFDYFIARYHGYVEKGLLAYLANFEVVTKAFF